MYLVLHEDSTLTWYSERGESSPEGGVLLKDAPEMIAAGQVLFLQGDDSKMSQIKISANVVVIIYLNDNKGKM